MDHKKLSAFHAIVQSSWYATLATVTADGQPWNSPVYICHDNQFNFYWASALSSQYSKHIAQTGSVFLVLFDSHAPWGEGQGVYITAAAAILSDASEISKVCALRSQKSEKANQVAANFIDPSPRRLYKATPRHIWLNDEALVDGMAVDVKVALTLTDIIKSQTELR